MTEMRVRVEVGEGGEEVECFLECKDSQNLIAPNEEESAKEEEESEEEASFVLAMSLEETDLHVVLFSDVLCCSMMYSDVLFSDNSSGTPTPSINDRVERRCGSNKLTKHFKAR